MYIRDFIAKWQASSLKERSASQEHFIDVCRLLGQQTPSEADPQGQWYTFEKGAAKQGGGQGFSDVWRKGCFAWEYKGKAADLNKAYDQLLRYRSALEKLKWIFVNPENFRPGITVEQITTQAEKELKKRTLTNLYNARPAWLAKALNRERSQ